VKAILYGILASFFFAFTFVFNRLMSDSGGSWIWSASLRYLFMIPLLFIIVVARRRWPELLNAMRQHPWRWIGWSLVGFGLFYAPICFAATFSPAWLVAGVWQFTIIAGSLLAPLFRHTVQTANGSKLVRNRIPLTGLCMSSIILLGIILMEWSQATHASVRSLMFGMIPLLIATFAYPLGNRKMMELCGGKIHAVERTFGMTIASLPLWVVLSIYQLVTHGLPSGHQSLQTLVVALFSGVIATVLFFCATDLANGDMPRLAAVEATQSGEVVFALLGELWLIPTTFVSVMGMVGLGLVVVGMVIHSLFAHRLGRAREPRQVMSPIQETTQS
jgi:drug/metabolite transporter (DMT)-like permease